MRRFKTLGAIFVILLCIASVNGQTLRIAVAANAQFVMDSLKTAFQKDHPGKIDLIVSSSGKLTAQIKHGAPYDIFLSADMKYPSSIYEAGDALAAPAIYAFGKLVLWTAGKTTPGLDRLRSSTIKTIAVANPAIAPYGVAAITALKKTGMFETIKDKIVYGESIAQVNQYLLSGAADVAFTAMSVVKSPDMSRKGKWIEVKADLYQPIAQGVIILKFAKRNHLKMARAFYDFLFSSGGRAIFRYFGYRIH
ncbi:molybdate ABC transporter substrate-binding protein [Arachidicoccus terrestris]|uniref:molybdate ABC transporter substrate-binding protein n=1 Tax=Arachidicoccus terrestris TaxID=2875539 RepID=UPI001CC52C3F|nr:molybdate ABC transporter substrate-binding protein [Arachidicoccus terrestris]UAY54342.1 molybdate ABC transporter substrate-binding protein [Arachidicoccus terrestris]